MIADPIFIIGTERSGSNLLRLLLNAHPNIAIPHPPHIMRDFAPLVAGYGDLRADKNFHNLIDDVVLVVEKHFSPWPIKVTKKMILDLVPSKSLYGIYIAFYEAYLKHEKKPRWGCKSTFMFAEIKTILTHHQAPRFIHLVRDPRDIAVSASQSIFSKYHPYKMAELWKLEQSEIKKWEHLKDEGKLLTVRYEDLTADPSGVVKKIMNFLNEEYQASQLEYFKDKEAKRLAGLSESWKQVENPVSSKSVGQFKNKLKSDKIAMIEYLCHDLMSDFSYPLVNEIKNLNSPSLKEKIAIELIEQFAKWKTEINAFSTDKNFNIRWEKKFLLKKIFLKQKINY